MTATDLGCLSASGGRVPLSLLEALAFGRHELEDALVDLRRRAGATQLCVLSTCERTELYATWVGDADPEALVAALAQNRGLPHRVVQAATTPLSGRRAAEHLMRVTAGLESFVLGESHIVGQVRVAAEASRSSGASGLELERLLATAVNTSRRVHRHTSFGERGRSVAAAAVRLAATERDGDLGGCRVLVVGAGQVATEAACSAVRLGAGVTICSRAPRLHADRFAAFGVDVVDLGQLLDNMATADVVIFGTTSPQRLVDAGQLEGSRSHPPRALLVIDLCVPRNVDPAVGSLRGVDLVDLAGLRVTSPMASDVVTRDVARAERIVGEELDRYLRWLASRSAVASVRRLRADVETCTRGQVEHATRGVPSDLRPIVEDGVRRAMRQLAHGPTKRLLEAAEAGDDRLVEILAGLFAPTSHAR